MSLNGPPTEPCDEEEEIKKQLEMKHDVFRRIFSPHPPVLTQAQVEEAKHILETEYPDHQLAHLLPDLNGLCVSSVFDAASGKFYNPNVLAPLRRSKGREEFDVVTFIREQSEKNRGVPLSFDRDVDLYVNLSFDERRKQDIIVDHAIKGIAKLALVLNQSKKVLPYNILEVHSEKYIQ